MGSWALADAFSGDNTRHRLFCSQRRTPEGGLAEALSPPLASFLLLTFFRPFNLCVCVCADVCVWVSGRKQKRGVYVREYFKRFGGAVTESASCAW